MRLLTLATSALLVFASAANAQYVGVTATAFDGGQGVFTYNRACHAAHPGSRMCTAEEMTTTVNPPLVGSPGDRAWVKPSDSPLPTASNCQAWIALAGNTGFTIFLDGGGLEKQTCDSVYLIACCIPVPEPSASLSIPSGVAMLYALSKLRGVSLMH